MERTQTSPAPVGPSATTGLDRPAAAAAPDSAARRSGAGWREALPLLRASRVTLRELRKDDAASLLTMLTPDDVTRFISPPPGSIDALTQFIEWTQSSRDAGQNLCYGVVPDGLSTPIGLFQLRSLEADFRTAEWGFAIGSPFWGTGLFTQSASLVLDFAFDVVGVHRIEARASAVNGRGNGALRKMGAVQEGLLRRSFFRNGQYQDQLLWSILSEDWHARRDACGLQIH